MLAGVAVIHCAAQTRVTPAEAADPKAAYRQINVAGTLQLARQPPRPAYAVRVCQLGEGHGEQTLPGNHSMLPRRRRRKMPMPTEGGSGGRFAGHCPAYRHGAGIVPAVIYGPECGAISPACGAGWPPAFLPLPLTQTGAVWWRSLIWWICC